MRNLKVGIAGCGLIALHKYIPSLRKAGVDVSAVCDLDKELAGRVAREKDIPRFYADFGEMLGEGDFDLICICTPPGTHAELGLSALREGAHLLIEKPMALTTPECDRLIEESDRRGRKICVGHSDLFYPPIIKARELVNRGRIGEFRGMRILLSTPVDYALSKKGHWIHKLPGGILGETGPHAVYLTNAFIRGVSEAGIATHKSTSFEWPDYDDIRIELKGENGISSIVITHSTNQWDAKVDIFGSDRNLYIDMHEFLIQEHSRKNLNPLAVGTEVLARSFKSLLSMSRNSLLKGLDRISYGHELLIKEFVESIRNGTPSPVLPESGREAVRVMELVLENLEKKRCAL